MAGYEILLFDLGGVLADFRGLKKLRELLPQGVDIEEIRKQWLLSPAVKRYETGRSNTMEFASEFIDEWKITLTPSQFLAEFASWVTGPYEGVMSLLVSLKSDYILACLTNCNELHWDWVTNKSGLGGIFHHLYSSHVIGFAKPDFAAFEHVLSDLGTVPERILFFDDSPMNVENARLLGIDSHLVSGVMELDHKLKKLGIIDEKGLI
jgi:HAD superfamily hydrolase (TIGR01509 family)